VSRLLFGIILILPTLGAAFWSVQPNVRAMMAVRALNPPRLTDNAANDPEAALQYKRDIQRVFSGSGIHVPLEDIELGKTADNGTSRIQGLNSKACGGGADLYVWLPIRFRLPVVGERVIDRCWRFRARKAG
jgi:hypothetical protein